MSTTLVGHAPFYLITHPDVVISREVPVPRWPLSERGLQRMRLGLTSSGLVAGVFVRLLGGQAGEAGAGVCANVLRPAPAAPGSPFTSRKPLPQPHRQATQ